MRKQNPKLLVCAASCALLPSFFLGALLFVGGCNGSSSVSNPPLPPGPTSTQIRIGDAPVDAVIAFEVTIATLVSVTPSGGGAKVNITVGANRLELSHMSAKLEPLGILGVPPGTYVSADITITNPEMTFLNASGTPVSIQGASQTVTVTLNPALTIGSAPVVLNMDLNVANSLATDASGTITGFNFSGSSFTFSTKAIAAENQQEDDSGEMEDVTGLVTNVSGSNFTMNVGQSGAQLTFATDSTTVFSDGVTNIAGTLNQIVKVEGVTKADGTLFAKEVEGLETQMGSEFEGLITLVTGNPATSLAVLAQDGIGAGMDNSKVGVSFTADVSGLASSKYTVDQGNVDLSGLTVPGPNFPFDPNTIHAGQRVEVESTVMMPMANASIAADKVKLQQQAISGTVSNFLNGSGGAATFDLTLASNSYLSVLTGQTVVHVFQQPGTNNKFGTISNTNVLRVRGLLFWTGTTFNMIARRITP